MLGPCLHKVELELGTKTFDSVHLFAGGPEVPHEAGAQHQAVAGFQSSAVQQRQHAAVHCWTQPTWYC